MARGFNYAPGASEDVQVADSKDVPRTQLSALAGSKNAVVREHLARRTDLVLSQMVTLAHDRVMDVRAALAANPTVPAAIIELLSEDRHIPVLSALAANPSTPHVVLERLAGHRNPGVRKIASRRIAERDMPVRHDPQVPIATGL